MPTMLTLRYRPNKSTDPNTFQANLRPEGFIEINAEMRMTDVLPLKSSVILACARGRNSSDLPNGLHRMTRFSSGELTVYRVKLNHEKHTLKTDIHLLNVPAELADLWMKAGLLASFAPGSSW